MFLPGSQNKDCKPKLMAKQPNSFREILQVICIDSALSKQFCLKVIKQYMVYLIIVDSQFDIVVFSCWLKPSILLLQQFNSLKVTFNFLKVCSRKNTSFQNWSTFLITEQPFLWCRVWSKLVFEEIKKYECHCTVTNNSVESWQLPSMCILIRK